MDRIDKIIAFEQGYMENADLPKFFQELIDDGTAWTLQGMYGRIASSLIRSGVCHAKRKENS
jgi:hypothetical protein